MGNVLQKAVWSGAVLLALLPGTAWAGYQIGESTPLGTAAGAVASGGPGAAGAGPIRLARFSFVQGNVTWREGDGAAWSPASVNLPIRQGAQVWVTNGGRAEVQFDDGSLLRLGNGAVVTLQTLYSDSSGEFTELNLSEGLSALELRGTESIYQIDTPFVSVKSEGPAKVRVGVDSNVEVAVRLGKATVEGHGTKTTLSNGDYVDLDEAASAYNVNPLPDEDSWDRFNDDRDQQLADAESDHRLPSDIALVAGNLDDYGSWHDDPRYGQVWCPRETDADWRPYQHGHWTWVEPFGWTWVADEAWGWAPYHYGTWVSEPYGWGWVPGPARQYWCPAVVHFSEYNGGIAWAPLAPGEVRYPPALAVGFRGGNWAAFFSIGGAAVYYPHNNFYCEPRPFNNVTVNRITYVNSVTNVYNRQSFQSTVVNRNIYVHNSGFVPTNARNGLGVTTASSAEFGGGGHYHPQTAGGAAFWTRGRSIGAPQAGFAPVAGPGSVHPTALAATASRSFLPGIRPNAFAEQRSVFRAPLPQRVARFAPAQRFSAPASAGFQSPARLQSGGGRLNFDARPGGGQPQQNAQEGRQSFTRPGGFRSDSSSPGIDNRQPRGDNVLRQDNRPFEDSRPRQNNPAGGFGGSRGGGADGSRGYRYREASGSDSRPAGGRSESRNSESHNGDGRSQSSGGGGQSDSGRGGGQGGHEGGGGRGGR